MANVRHEFRRTCNKIEWAIFSGVPTSGAEVRAALEPFAQAVDDEGRERLTALIHLAEGGGDGAPYRDRYGVAGVRRFRSAARANIYLMQVETFPDHVNNVYFIADGRRATLYDCGSQTAQSDDDLKRAGAVLGRVFKEPLGFDDIHEVVVSHAHIDHFGGVQAFRGRAPIAVHEFDARVVTHFEERIVTAAMQLRIFLERAGVPEAVRAELEQMYVFTKRLFASVPVDRRLKDGDRVGDYVAHHVPGHCPGQICLQVHDVLLTADHILPRITPHQSPESITPWTGLDHYFLSLEKVRKIPGIALALPGHEQPIHELARRIDEIQAFHQARLAKVRALCTTPQTIAELALALFGEQAGYGRLLALEEAAAHVEYLARRAELEIANLNDLVRAPNPVLRYRAA